jgi:hypothetical protein
VYSNKKGLKNHPDKIFITENLTKYRTELVKQLAELKVLDISPFINRHLNVVETKAGTP